MPLTLSSAIYTFFPLNIVIIATILLINWDSPELLVTFQIHFIFGGSLESPRWLLLAFCSKILGGGGDLQMILLLLYECNLSSVDNQR